MDSGLIPRRALDVVLTSLQSFRAVVLQGARQTGKSTLADMVAQRIGARGVTLDREEDLTAAIDDPPTFLASLSTPAVIDEIQRAGDRLVFAIKRELDATRERGRYLLTGSTNFLTTPVISESLAGRIDLVTLWPLSVGEVSEGSDRFVDRAFDGVEALLAHRDDTYSRSEYLGLVCRGGYPEVLDLDPRARLRWHERYLETVLRREIETASDLRRFDALHAMARLLVSTTGNELVSSRLAQQLNIDRSTAETYEPWLETAFLIHRVPAWGRNVAAKLVRRPKLHACDTGLAASILGKDVGQLELPSDPATGPLVESFVIGELAKQLTWSATRARLHHLRDRDGLEIDVILEAADGRVAAIEVKTSTVPRPAHAAPMATLRDRLDRVGQDFVVGAVLHTGDRRIALGDRLVALPIADLWT